MKLGLIGAGNMASAIARGLGEPVLVADVDRARAEQLASATGGEALPDNRAVAERVDAVVLCHKPAQLDQVADEIRDGASAVISILGGTALAKIEAAYPDRPVYRFMPNIPVEVRRGVLCYAAGTRAGDGPEDEVLDLFGRLGTVVPLAEHLLEPATALMGCAPAFLALVVEALADAGVRHGLPADVALTLTTEGFAGSAEVLRETGNDTRGLRRRVTSPGGSTARGLAALEQGGVRSAFADAVDAVVEFGRR